MIMETPETPSLFAPLSRSQAVEWDWNAAGHSTHGHPVTAHRVALQTLGCLTAAEALRAGDGRIVRAAGLVICRQRPGTAKGTLFLTLEDETGFINVILWKNVFKRHTVLIKTESFLGIEGRIQEQDGVVHLIARRAFSIPLSVPAVQSYDFH